MISALYYDMFETDEEVLRRDGCLFQGDIIRFVKVDPDLPKERYEDILGYLVLSNSCDLDRDDLEIISLSPILTFKSYLNNCIDDLFHNDKLKSQKEFENNVTTIILKEMNYDGKFTFYIPPINEFSNMPSVAFLNDIRSIEVKSIEKLLKNRIYALKPPWREKLGYKVAYIFNRVAIDDTKKEEKESIKSWWTSVYGDIHLSTIAKINDRRASSSQ
jgi:hypothetical protein